MSGSGVPCRAQDGGLQQLLDRIQTVRIRRRIGDLDLLWDNIHRCYLMMLRQQRCDGKTNVSP